MKISSFLIIVVTARMISEHNSSGLSVELVIGSRGELRKIVSRKKDMCRLQRLNDHQLEENHVVNENQSSEYCKLILVSLTIMLIS